MCGVLVLAVAACGDDDGPMPQPDGPLPLEVDGGVDAGLDAGPQRAELPEAPPGGIPVGIPEVELVTYNLALVGAVKGGAERKPELVDAVNTLDADVVCLQEAYHQYTDPMDFAALISEKFPYAYWSFTGDTLWRNGVVLASRHPLYRGRELLYASNDPGNFVDRIAVAADVLVEGESYFHVICTHMQAGLGEPGLTVKAAEIDELDAWADLEGYLDSPHDTFLLGDFNLGPDPIGACTESTDPMCLPPDLANYDKLLETWLDVGASATFCTQCRDVFLPMQVIPLFEDEPDQRIDLCLYLGTNGSLPGTVQRIMDEPVEIMAGGETLTSLSDHLGVSCRFGP
jgi:endonuclease/exonuclease/phosphatase family metal-dependent hydrolase